jgi:CheY-like chemotaxis protein
VTPRPRFLVLSNQTADRLTPGEQSADLVQVPSWPAAFEALRRENFDALLADLGDPSLLDTLRTLYQAERILAVVPDGVAVVDFDLKIHWANPTFQSWCGNNPIGQGFYEALGSPRVLGPEFCPFHSAFASLSYALADDQTRTSASVSTRLQCRGNRHIDLHITPIRALDALFGPPHHTSLSPSADSPLFIALGRDVTALVNQQQKLDALHQAGRELTALAPDQLAEMSVAERVELLKVNIRRLTRDLLHYEVIEIRILDPATRILEPLLQDGMTTEAAKRVLYSAVEGNGVTGFVAATGKSHRCPDTLEDPLYLPGAPGARSSLTVPLLLGDQVIGTFNVESPRRNAFGEEDQQFAEIFSHDIAAALYTLELLSAEKSSATSQSIEAVAREVALPVDEILADATTVLERYIGHEAELADRIRAILANARRIKESIQKVGEDINPPPGPGAGVGTLTGSFPRVGRDGAGQPLKGVRVLVADSDDRVRRSAHGLLGRWGCVVETARDGQEALTMARLSRYDAIVADIRLPDLNGYEMYSQLRQAQPRARVVLMTGYGYDPAHSLVKARQEGLRHVLFKPFRVDQLRDALQGLPSDLEDRG